jgi:hypothetical protein
MYGIETMYFKDREMEKYLLIYGRIKVDMQNRDKLLMAWPVVDFLTLLPPPRHELVANMKQG